MAGKSICTVDDCEQVVNARGLCAKHYWVAKKNGSLPPTKQEQRSRTCIALKCRRKYFSKGFCTLHYQRWKTHGDPTINAAIKHGQYKTPIYNSWDNMMQRCYNPNDDRYHRYGGRGIRVCFRWRIFKNFYDDMAPRPKDRTIDRIDNDGNYSCGHCPECIWNGWPANCRWATSAEQHANQTYRNGHSK